MKNRAMVLSVFLLASFLSAGEAPKTDLSVELGTAHAEQLAAFCLKIDSKTGSWENDVREQALALARKLDPAAKSIAEAAKATRADMNADEKAADKAARDNFIKTDKDRISAEAALDAKSPGSPPNAESIREQFELARYEMARENLELAQGLSPNPVGKDFALRTKFMSRAAEIMATPKWRYEKKLKEQIDALKRAQYTPWAGKWKTEWGVLTLTQTGQNVAGTADKVRIKGVFDGKSLKGNWSRQTAGGTIEWQLAPDDRSFQGTNKEIPGKSAGSSFSGTRAEEGAE